LGIVKRVKMTADTVYTRVSYRRISHVHCAAVRLLRAEGLHLSNGRRQSRPWHARTTETLQPVLNKRMQTKRGVKKTVYILL